MKGWMGKLLRVNLSKGTVKGEELSPQLTRDFLGARGLGSKILYDEIDPACSPLRAANKLVFATGPLTGTTFPAASRYVLVTKSPLTGGIACSNSGGFFGPEMRFAGYDVIIIEGKSKNPVYLWVHDGQAELRPADHLWGKLCSETDDLIRAETDPQAKVACIGPAGENGCLISAVMNDKYRAAGRSGVGAVMGSKRLKGIAVRGRKRVPLAHLESFNQARRSVLRKLKEAPITSHALPNYGTNNLVNVINDHGLFPTRNFQTGVFQGAEKINGETLADTLVVKRRACFSCPIACTPFSRISSGKYRCEGEGPEFETVWALGADCDVDNLEAITKANYLCNEYGIDTMSAGATIACAMELVEKGYLSDKGCSTPLRFGNPDAMVEAVRMMGENRGLGKRLARGSYRLAEECGHPELAMTVKKQEMAAYDPRGAKGMTLTYATSNRGACHLKSFTVGLEIMGLGDERMDPLAYRGKGKLAKGIQDAVAAIDSLGVCLFLTYGIGLPDMLPAYVAATGEKITLDEAVLRGERIWNLERLFNLKAGLTGKEDSLPPRFTKEPMPEGPAKGHVVELKPILAEYYRDRGWSKRGTIPQRVLERLGLAD